MLDPPPNLALVPTAYTLRPRLAGASGSGSPRTSGGKRDDRALALLFGVILRWLPSLRRMRISWFAPFWNSNAILTNSAW